MINVQIPLPDHVVRDAEAAGLLTPRALALLIKEEIRRKSAQRLVAGAKRASSLGARKISDSAIADIVREVRDDAKVQQD